MKERDKGRVFGVDLMRGEATVGQPKGKKAKSKGTEPGLTWVQGDREYADLDETSQKILDTTQTGTSIFDPVLCELAYRWFCPAGGLILDPFAGGSVRGIVAAKLDRPYVGIELRDIQVEANQQQARDLCPDDAHPPRWIVGDSKDVATLSGLAPESVDFIFSCPPYADLERYSDDPRDLSTMDYDDFVPAYTEIIAAAVALLKPDRFACFVVGEVRDRKEGYYRGFVPDTIRAFEAAGAHLYNEAILLTAIGSLPLRAGLSFRATRKLGKTHQNVLVFLKGDCRRATEACGTCDFGTAPEADTEAMVAIE